MFPGLIQPSLVFIKSNSSDCNFKPFYMVPHGHFSALPQMNHQVEGPAGMGIALGLPMTPSARGEMNQRVWIISAPNLPQERKF